MELSPQDTTTVQVLGCERKGSVKADPEVSSLGSRMVRHEQNGAGVGRRLSLALRGGVKVEMDTQSFQKQSWNLGRAQSWIDKCEGSTSG